MIVHMSLKGNFCVSQQCHFLCRKQRQTLMLSSVTIECFPNELFLEIFQYLDAVHLLQAFYNLNNRFNQLLLIQIQQYHFDFSSLSTTNFERFLQEYLPLIDTRVFTCHFSDDLHTQNLSKYFQFSNYRLNQFPQLRSLSIDCIYSFELINEITSQLKELPSLTHLRMTLQSHLDPEIHFRDFISHIWRLSTLTHCDINVIYPYVSWLMDMSVVSTSIRCLTLKTISYDWIKLSELVRYTPNLQHLVIGEFYQYIDTTVETTFNSLISFNVIIHKSIDLMRSLFLKMSNLRSLTVEMQNVYFDGHQWETLLRHSFPHLNVFRLKMSIEFSSSEEIDDQVDQFLDSFSSSFWLNEHQWFVRCHWCPSDMNKTGLLYTLPYPCETFAYIDEYRSKSTGIDRRNSYSRVKTLSHINRRRTMETMEVDWPRPFLSVRHLKVKFPLNEYFWTIIPTFDQLISLDVTLNQTFAFSQLQLLLDRSPRLSSLRFSCHNHFPMRSFQFHHSSLRHLQFFQELTHNYHYFTSEECGIFTETPLANQCELLVIDVHNRTDILQLMEKMPRLRVLRVRCPEELIEWLHNELSCSITRNPLEFSQIDLKLDQIRS